MNNESNDFDDDFEDAMDLFIGHPHFNFERFKECEPELDMTKSPNEYSIKSLNILISKHNTKIDGLKYPVLINMGGSISEIDILTLSIIKGVADLDYKFADIEELIEDSNTAYIPYSVMTPSNGFLEKPSSLYLECCETEKLFEGSSRIKLPPPCRLSIEFYCPEKGTGLIFFCISGHKIE